MLHVKSKDLLSFMWYSTVIILSWDAMSAIFCRCPLPRSYRPFSTVYVSVSNKNSDLGPDDVKGREIEAIPRLARSARGRETAWLIYMLMLFQKQQKMMSPSIWAADLFLSNWVYPFSWYFHHRDNGVKFSAEVFEYICHYLFGSHSKYYVILMKI